MRVMSGKLLRSSFSTEKQLAEFDLLMRPSDMGYLYLVLEQDSYE